ncbi:MAG: DegT/DnrJ/EryC1/StrS family aminotransferase [Desulforegulaceae bacterium]|nr:DegT/DnrJ/EryC1/StrS family aminotransferase [Desulforegulaceae bacterium]
MPGFELFGDLEKKHVSDVLESGILMRYNFDSMRNGHWKAKEFEEKLSSKLNVDFTHLCSSGTAALSIALASCGIGKGDEVIVPPFTFVATIEAIIAAGAMPVFSDIDKTLCLDPDLLESKITKKTKAIMPVHMCGAMADINKIKNICEKNSLILIEDACQAIGASINNVYAGTFGDMGCFSFDFVKTITCGEGGAVVTNKKELYENAHAFSDHGHDHIGNDRGKENHPFPGLNFRISELNAAVGVAQLERFDEIISIQRKNKQILKNELKDLKNIELRQIIDEKGDNGGFLSFFTEDENAARKILENLNKNKADGTFYWYDNNWHYLRKWDHFKEKVSLYKTEFSEFFNPETINIKKSDEIMKRTLSMLIKLSWTEEEMEKRVEALKKSVNI